MQLILFFLAFTCLFQHSIEAYNILGIFPHIGKSHYIAFAPLFKELAERGHNVTVISHFPLPEKIPNYRDVSLAGTQPILFETIDVNLLPKSQTLIEFMSSILLMGLARDACHTLGHPEIQNLIKEQNKYDVIITEIFNENCFLALAHKLNAPYMGMSSCIMMPWMPQYFGMADNPSYIPIEFVGYSDKIPFLGRVYNSWSYIFHSFIIEPLLGNLPNEYTAQKYLGNDLPPLRDIARNTSMLLLNTHFSLNLPRPLPPAVVEVGGIHLPKLKKLPDDIKQYLDKAPNGVIYFSMGSTIKGSSFSEEKTRAFLDAFSELPYHVLWKYENESMADQLDNIKVSRWLPQYEILNHPNVVAFISHGGLLGTIEGIHSGVPLVSIPMFGDQFANVQAVVKIGGGVYLDWNDISKYTVLKALKQVLEPSFREQVKVVSSAYRDRLQSPMDTAIYWIEYVARHKGAHFMRSAAVDLYLFQYLLLDVIAFSAVIIGVIIYLFMKMVKLCRRNKEVKVKKLKKK